jgi:hypothetical protein
MFDSSTTIKPTSRILPLVKIIRKSIRVERHTSPEGDVSRLLIAYPGLDASEIIINRNDNRLEIVIAPEFAEGVIQSPQCYGHRWKIDRAEQVNAAFKEYGHVTWSQSGIDEIHSALSRMMSVYADDDKSLWVMRASRLVGVTLKALASLRDAGLATLSAEAFRNALPLDSLIGLSRDTRLDLETRKIVTDYLFDLPGYDRNLSETEPQHPKVYEHHGYLSMQIVWLVTAPSLAAMGRQERPAVETYYHTIKEAYRDLEYHVTPEGLVVSIHLHPKQAKVKVSAGQTKKPAQLDEKLSWPSLVADEA